MTDDKKRFVTQQAEINTLCKRRFFYRQAAEIYGGQAGFFTYGPPGIAMKTNLINQWRQHFVIQDALMEIEDSIIMMHKVLKASGHVDRFSDFMVKEVGGDGIWRADKLLEEVMEKKLEGKDVTEDQRKEYKSVHAQADAYGKDELHAIFQKYGIKAPESGKELTEPIPFNLMFGTDIGPSGDSPGFLRPETAQGMFLNYKFCVEQNANRLPFGIAQVGKSFRNEIAPRGGLTRQREFTQMEIEYFWNPDCEDHEKFYTVRDVVVSFFSNDDQEEGKDPIRMSVGEACDKGLVKNQILGYFIARTYTYLVSVGVHRHCIRFRQHLKTEMAHYAKDCWDAEVLCSMGWLECVGIAHRGCYDLTQHQNASKTPLMFQKTLETPIVRQVLELVKKSRVETQRHFKKDFQKVKDWIDAQSQEEYARLDSLTAAETIDIDGEKFELPAGMLKFEKKTEKITTHDFVPYVVEPAFGVDRIFTVVLEHSYYVRPKEDDAPADDKGMQAAVLRLPPATAPYKCSVLPLDQRIARDERYIKSLIEFRTKLAEYNLASTSDESGATIGRRYARNDELGIPFAITFDFTSLEDLTVTVRRRDERDQARVPLQDVPKLIRNMCSSTVSWDNAMAKYAAAA